MVAASRTYTCAQVSGEASHMRAQRKPKSLLNIYLLNEGPQNVNGNWWKHYQHCCNKKVWRLHYVALNACSETWTCYAGLVHCSVPKDICQEKKKRFILHIVAKCENHLLENDNFEKHFFMRSKRLTFFQFFHAFYTDSSTKTFMQGVPAHSTKF